MVVPEMSLIRPLLISASLLPATLVVMAACEVDAPAGVFFAMRDPQGLVDEATSMRLFVFDAKSGSCGADGDFGVAPADAKTFDLTREGCASGTWCGEVTLPQDGSEKIFGVQAQRATELFATGCAVAKIDQDPVEVAIKLFRAVAPACCNNGIVEPGELCDTGVPAGAACGALPSGACGGIVADAVCGCDCGTNEIAVDRVAGAPAPNPGEKTNVVLSFGPGDASLANGLRASFDDTGAGVSGSRDVRVRALDQNLFPIATPPLDTPSSLPIRCSSIAGTARVQTGGSLAPFTATSMIAAYSADTQQQIGSFDAFVVEIGPYGCADAVPVLVNTALGGVTDVRVASGPADTSLVVWQQGGRVMGRIFAKAGGLGTELTIATTGKTPRVAGYLGGFLVVYEGPGAGDDDGIFLKRVSASGTVEAENAINVVTSGVQDQPDVAVLGDGRAIVAFRSGGDVYAQRLTSQLQKVDGDQNAALHAALDGEQAAPAVAGGSPGFFAVAWENQSDGSVRARYLGAGTGFLFNPIDGQNTDFLASSPGIAGARRKPSVAVGGGGWLVMGWHDESGGHPGAFVRRFPLPATQ